LPINRFIIGRNRLVPESINVKPSELPKGCVVAVSTTGMLAVTPVQAFKTTHRPIPRSPRPGTLRT
jgi:hypothetical protein